MSAVYDGFWFPSSIRDRVLRPDTRYEYLNFREGTPVPPEEGEGGVVIRWPRLDMEAWQQIITALRSNQKQVPTEEWSVRLLKAISRVQDLWKSQGNPLRQKVLESLATCTGHSVGMLDFALSLLDLASVEDLHRAASCHLTQAVKGQFVRLNGLAGWVRFFEQGQWRRLMTRALLRSASYQNRPWRLQQNPPGLILGFAAGNVPGIALLFILLGLAAATREQSGPPIMVVKNSRREPLFTPLVLSALEMVDPLLLETTVVTVWDYTDPDLQAYLLAQADLVVAAASNETIGEIEKMARQVPAPSRPTRFHWHGHKVSFSTVGRECLEIGRHEPKYGTPLLEVVALLAALDVALWNQQGCLSSRVHFVEQGSRSKYHSPETYSQAVAHGLRLLDRLIPKEVSRKRHIHNLFDKYQAMAAGGTVQVFSQYDDDFLVVLANSPMPPERFQEMINDCQGRTVVVLPVRDVMEVPDQYLRKIPRQYLQSMSIALGDPDLPDIDPRLLSYAQALGSVGITGIRTAGRGAFPQLAYSWDGFIPLDLTTNRTKGYFTALEFDQPWAQIYETYDLVRQILDRNR